MYGRTIEFLKELPVAEPLREQKNHVIQQLEYANQKLEQADRRATTLAEEIAVLTADLAAAQVKIAELKSQLQEANHDGGLDEDAESILVALFRASASSGFGTSTITLTTQVPLDMVRYYIDLLVERGFAQQVSSGAARRSATWLITAKGRKYVVDRKLVG